MRTGWPRATSWSGVDTWPATARRRRSGRAAYQAVEDVTDQLAGQVWDALGAAETERLTELLRPMARAASAAMPFPNPIGLPRPA